MEEIWDIIRGCMSLEDEAPRTSRVPLGAYMVVIAETEHRVCILPHVLPPELILTMLL
jgi:hypothetical protein